jgi:hypothetical protein
MPDIHDTGQVLTISEYAAHVGAHPRTIKTWLANEELPGAAKDPFTSEWRIPRDTIRQKKAPETNGVATTPAAPQFPWHAGAEIIPFPQQPAEPAEPTRLENLDEEASFLRIEEAAYYLGIPQDRILENEEAFEVMYIGRKRRAEDERGAPMVPKRVIRRFEGL